VYKNLLLILIIALLFSCGNGNSEADKQSASPPFDFKYKSYTDLLNKYVADGLVDYNEMLKDRKTLDELIESHASVDLSGVSENQKFVFYINAYNIITLRSIIEAYPVKSIKDIKGVWDKRKWQVAGKNLTLNDIEHEILRKDFKEPRVHFAIVCASIGCPPLILQPYLADSIEEQLQASSINFANSQLYNRFDMSSRKAEISSIFDWFGEDFVDKYYDSTHFSSLSKKQNASLHFLIGHFPEGEREKLLNTEFDVSYLEYDWSLNKVK
jgi:Protein of unknown function, DUF547